MGLLRYKCTVVRLVVSLTKRDLSFQRLCRRYPKISNSATNQKRKWPCSWRQTTVQRQLQFRLPSEEVEKIPMANAASGIDGIYAQ